MNIPQELLYQQYVRRELETYRAPYDPEADSTAMSGREILKK